MRDGYNTSFWEKEENQHPVPAKSDFYDAVVVGAGITGISTALELQQKGFTVAILERYDIAFGTTGALRHTSTIFSILLTTR